MEICVVVGLDPESGLLEPVSPLSWPHHLFPQLEIIQIISSTILIRITINPLEKRVRGGLIKYAMQELRLQTKTKRIQKNCNIYS